MKIRELDARFIRYELRPGTFKRIIGDPITWRAGDPTETVTELQEHQVTVETLEEAQGIMLRCPKCAVAGGRHYLQVTFSGRGADDSVGSSGTRGGPTRWEATGSSLDDLSTTPSIQLVGGCAWHGYITNGETRDA